MAKSIGTLAAKLTLEDKAFIQGWNNAQKAAKKAANDIGKDVGDKAAKTWLKWTAALKVAKFAMRSMTNEIMEYRKVSPTVNAAVESLFDVGRTFRDSIVHPLLDAVAPAFTFAFESATDAINETLGVLESVGFTMEDVSNAALAMGGLVGNSFKAMSAGIESSLALMEEFVGLVTSRGSFSLLPGLQQQGRQRGIDASGRWVEAMSEIGKILGGDLSGVRPRRPSRMFVGAEKAMRSAGGRGPDLSMPVLERGTSDAMAKILGIQRPDKTEDKLDAMVGHLRAIDDHTKPKRGGDTIELGRLGGR